MGGTSATQTRGRKARTTSKIAMLSRFVVLAALANLSVLKCCRTTARNTHMWRVPRSLNIGHTSRIVEMIDLFPTLIELVSAMSMASAKAV